MKRFVLPILLLSVIQFIITTEMSMVMPLAPIIANTYGVESSLVASMSIGYALSGAAAPRLSKFADVFGEKKILLLALGVFGFGAFVISIYESLILFFIGRMILGLGFFILLGMIFNYTSNIIPYKRMGIASGIYKLAFGVAVMSSASIGGYIVERFSITELYRFMGVVVLFLVVLGLFLPNSSKSILTETTSSKANIKYLLLAAFLFNVPAIYFYNYFSIFLVSVDQSNMVILLYTVVGAGTLFSAIFILLFSDKIGKWNLLLFGGFLSSFIILGIYQFSETLMIISVFMFGFTYDTLWGLFMPVSGEIDIRNSNYILGILSMGMASANVFGGLTAPWIYRLGFEFNIIVSSISILTGSVVYLLTTREFRKRLNKS